MDIRAFNKDAAYKKDMSEDEFLQYLKKRNVKRYCRKNCLISKEGKIIGMKDIVNYSGKTTAPYIFIGHVLDHLADEIITSMKNLEGSIFIRCSSVGRRGRQHLKHGQLVVLEMYPPYQKVKTNWDTIIDTLSADPSVAEQIVAGNIPSILKEFFCDRTTSDYLTAISILCQGYLIAHNSDPIKLEQGTQKPKNKTVDNALMKIGWTRKFINSEAGKNVIDNIHKNSAREKCETKKYWIDVLGTNVDEVMRNINKEISNEKGLHELSDLITKIYNETSDIDELTVAKAYCAISDMLKED